MKKTIIALAVVAGLLSSVGTAEADIIYNSNPNFVKNGGFFGTYNMLTNPSPNGAGFYLIQNAAQSFTFPYPGQTPADSKLSAFSDHFFKLTTYGEVISASPSSANQLTLSNGQLYIGFDLIDSLNNNSIYYGWMSVSVSGVGTFGNVQFALNSYAYDNTGASITVGQIAPVPEPSTFALCGLGALGLGMAMRRKKTA